MHNWRMADSNIAMIASSWTFQLVSIPYSAHAVAERFADAPQWSSDLHLVHTVEGSGLLHLDGNPLETNPDVVIVVPPFRHARWEKRSGHAWRMINIHVHIFDPDGQPLHEHSPLPTSFCPPDLDLVHRRLEGWHDDWCSGVAVRQACAAASAVALVGEYLARFGRIDDRRETDQVMQQAGELLRRSANQPFQGGELAQALGLSVSQLNRRFRASYGQSPKRYWAAHRLGCAQAMLTSTRYPVQHIAQELQFSDAYYFSRWFKSQSGLSPNAFRRQFRGF